MEYYDVLKIRESWGNKPCEHTHIEKLYYTGAFLTVYVCRQCGKEYTIAEKLELDIERKVAKKM